MSVFSTIYGTGIKYNYIDRGICSLLVFAAVWNSGAVCGTYIVHSCRSGGRLQGPAGGPSLMATEPVGRSRIRSDEVVVPGRAIPRMCHGEEDEEWLAQRDHLVEECERAIDLPSECINHHIYVT